MPGSDGVDVGRGEATRRRLIEAAVRIFGERGFYAAGTRELADAAGANLAAIPYHFGSKDGLYRAAAEEIALAGRTAFAPLLHRMENAQVTSLARNELAELAAALVGGLTRALVGHLGTGARATFIVREQTQPGPAFDILYDGFILAVHESLTRVVAAARGIGPNTTHAVVEAHALIGSVLGFVVARETLCRRLGWDGYDSRRVGEIETAVVGMALQSLGLQPAHSQRSTAERTNKRRVRQ